MKATLTGLMGDRGPGIYIYGCSSSSQIYALLPSSQSLPVPVFLAGPAVPGWSEIFLLKQHLRITNEIDSSYSTYCGDSIEVSFLQFFMLL
jgi:hypothetical protein